MQHHRAAPALALVPAALDPNRTGVTWHEVPPDERAAILAALQQKTRAESEE